MRHRTAWPRFAHERRLSEVEASVPSPEVERGSDVLADVVRRLPPGPFTAAEFLDLAIGLNAIRNAADVELMLDQLVDDGVIRPLDDGGVPRWVVMA